MKRAARLPVIAGFLCCLAASPALADLAATDSGLLAGGAIPVLDILQILDGAASDISSLSDAMVASSFDSTSPASGPGTSMGVDSSQSFLGGGASLSTLAGIAGGASLATSPAATAPSSDTPAAPPNVQSLTVASTVGNGTAVTPSDSSSTSNPVTSAAFQIDTQNITPQDTTPVPVPAAAFLIGSGFLALLPMRRSPGRQKPPTARERG